MQSARSAELLSQVTSAYALLLHSPIIPTTNTFFDPYTMMIISDLIDTDRFIASLLPPSKSYFSIWRDTAFEIAGDRTVDIARTFSIWDEIPPTELQVEQLVSYFDELLRILGTRDRQHSFITAEALPYRRSS